MNEIHCKVFKTCTVLLLDSAGVLILGSPSRVQQHAQSGKPKMLWTLFIYVVVYIKTRIYCLR